MDLEDNETAMNSFDSQIEELKGTIELLEAQLAQNQTQMSDMKVCLEDSKAQVNLMSTQKQSGLEVNFHQSQRLYFQHISIKAAT